MDNAFKSDGIDSYRGKRIVLNVGGKRFETLVETLRKFPHTMLGAMFNSGLAKPDESGEFFFDRDPKLFQVVLNFYRHGKIIIPANQSSEMVKEELDFFGISVSDRLDGLGEELKQEADFVAQKRLTSFIDEFLMPKMKTMAQTGHYSFEIGLVPERHSMNNMTNLPNLQKNSHYYDLFSERENRRRLTKMLKNIQVHSQWDRSEQVNITTKEFLFECFKLTVYWYDDPSKLDINPSETSSQSSGVVQTSTVLEKMEGTASM